MTPDDGLLSLLVLGGGLFLLMVVLGLIFEAIDRKGDPRCRHGIRPDDCWYCHTRRSDRGW